MTGREINIRAMIPSALVGALIGKEGRNIKRILQNFKLDFKLDNAGAYGGYLVHSHELRSDLSYLWKDIARTLSSSGPNYNKDNNNELTEFSIDFLFPDAFVEVLNCLNAWEDVARFFQVKLVIKSNFMPDSTERLVRVSISHLNNNRLSSFKIFINLVGRYLDENATIVLSYPGNIFYSTPTFDTDDNSIVRTNHYWNTDINNDIMLDFST